MSYVRTTWQNGDTITAAKLNNIETGILGNESDISNVNTNLGNDISALQGTVASTYDSTSTYAVGDYVYYNDILYRCTTAITTAEAWTAGHWTAVVLGDDVTDLKSAINGIVYRDASLPQPEQAWIRYSNGEKVASSATYLFVFRGNLPKKIRAFLTSDTNVLCAIAFYNSETVGTSSYIASDSVDFLNGTHNDGQWYEATTPLNCKTIAITTKIPSNSVADYKILFSEDCTITSLLDRYDFGSPFEHNKCFGHLFTNQVTASFGSNILIPCQSIFDVQVTARLGFKYIEANVHKTSDGKYVVTHGINGKLGNDFETLNGNSANAVVIANTTLSDLRTNYRYCSSYDKYKVPISTLEEFLLECKQWGISCVLQYVDNEELEIAESILGKNIIVYNGTRQAWSGMIMEYLNYSTKEQIVDRCKTIGSPYMYNMANPTSFTIEELEEIIEAVHQTGCYIGFTGVYMGRNDIFKYSKLPFDFNASGLQVNDFDVGNLWNYNGDLDFSQITHTGTVENGILHLADGQYIRISDTANFLTKVSMHITFSGKLYVDGVGSGIYMESDGENSMYDSRFYLNATPTYRWDSSGDTYIKNISIRASKC